MSCQCSLQFQKNMYLKLIHIPNIRGGTIKRVLNAVYRQVTLFQYFGIFECSQGNIGRQVLTKCIPNSFYVKDHFKRIRKHISIILISPIFAELRLKTFGALATAKGPQRPLRDTPPYSSLLRIALSYCDLNDHQFDSTH